MLRTIGQKISRIGDVIQQPRLLPLRLRGVEVRMFESLHKPWLLNSGIKTVFDVGANTGQFARAVREVLPEAFIYSFEPLPDCFAQLQRAMSGETKFQAFNAALAERNGDAAFYRSEWSPSSSLLPMRKLHKENFPFTAGESKETVRVRKLDEYTDELNIENEILVKLDVQGTEDKVIAGGRRLLRRAKILIVETSMDTLYEGQPLFGDIFRLLEEQGFRYKGAISQLFSPLDGSVLQANSIFVR
jgi:FkbM family methyltransferase